MDGRPKVHLDGAEIADAVLGVGGIIGPSHAFTPWTGIYAYYGSLDKCYQEHAKDIHFIELGLSADTDYADKIATYLPGPFSRTPMPIPLGPISWPGSLTSYK